MNAEATNLEQQAVNTIRLLSAEMVEKAKSGHPGMPMATAPLAHVLWTRIMRYNPQNPDWFNRDRFILSAGHGSPLIYSMLYLTGYDLSLDDIKSFRQFQSKTPGHPELGITAGVDATTGPLGQGFSMGVGMAFATRMLGSTFNREKYNVVDHYVYAICSDGDLMEGISSEAASLAGHQKLGNLIYLYDDNHISIEGSTDVAFTETVADRFKAYGWHVQELADANDTDAIEKAIHIAQEETERPSLIKVRTHIGYGSPLQDSEKSHGAALGEENIKATKENFGWPEDSDFLVPDEVLKYYRTAGEAGKDLENKWNKQMDQYAKKYPEEAAELRRRIAGELPEGWDKDVKPFKKDDGPVATRSASGKILNAIAVNLPELAGGSADLAPSNKSDLADIGYQSFDDPTGRNFHFGVREHAMGAAVNGMALHGGVIPYGATFLVFSDYCKPALRLASIMNTHVIFIFSHDSIGVGEDGPTHQPIEHMAALRCLPNFTVYRPADANETAECWRQAILRKEPCMLALTRQNLPILTKKGVPKGTARGAYVVADSKGEPDLIIIASGSEVHAAMEAKDIIGKKAEIRVVSMPSFELFEEQTDKYKESVLPKGVTKRLCVEAGTSFGWHKWAGSDGEVIALDRFGESGPFKELLEKYGFTGEAVAKKAEEMLK